MKEEYACRKIVDCELFSCGPVVLFYDETGPHVILSLYFLIVRAGKRERERNGNQCVLLPGCSVVGAGSLATPSARPARMKKSPIRMGPAGLIFLPVFFFFFFFFYFKFICFYKFTFTISRKRFDKRKIHRLSAAMFTLVAQALDVYRVPER